MGLKISSFKMNLIRGSFMEYNKNDFNIEDSTIQSFKLL